MELIFLPNIIPHFLFDYHLLKNVFFEIARKIFANLSYNNNSIFFILASFAGEDKKVTLSTL